MYLMFCPNARLVQFTLTILSIVFPPQIELRFGHSVPVALKFLYQQEVKVAHKHPQELLDLLC